MWRGRRRRRAYGMVHPVLKHPIMRCFIVLFALALASTRAAEPLRALIIDGQNNHRWVEITPVIQEILEETNLFAVDVATTPPRGAKMETFLPHFASYDVVISNYNGDLWPRTTRDRFVTYMREGGGFVAIHAANNAFPEWPEYNEIIGLGGWGNRDERWGPYLFFREGEIVRDSRPGRGGTHGARRPFLVTLRNADHPITRGLPEEWMHARDELYGLLRGPGENLTLLATALSKPKNYAPEHEPILFTVRYGKGRTFQMTLGHDVHAMRCQGFATTLQRGAEWAATGGVTRTAIPETFPSSSRPSLRPEPEPLPKNPYTTGLEERPNIVVIVADDLGWNDVSYHGGPIPTPNLDRFVRESVELDRFYVCPFCSPTRAGLMTGRYPHRFGMHGSPLQYHQTKGLPPSETTLAEMLREAGYKHRHAVGKWHLGNSSRAFHPRCQGFTHFYGHSCGMIGYFNHRRGGQRDWHRDDDPLVEEGYATDLMTEEAVSVIRSKSRQPHPFFLYLAYNAVHTPNQAKPEDMEAVKPAFEAARQRHAKEDHSARLPNRLRPGPGKNKRNWKDGWGGELSRGQTFFAMTHRLDQGIGRVLQAIDEAKIGHNTLVLIMSDNGGTSNNHPLRGRKGRRWEGGVRVPAAIRWPRLLHGGRVLEEPMAYIDVFPTLSAAAGLDPPASAKPIDGINLLPILSGRGKLPKRPIYLGRGAVTEKKWKLIEGELYDLSRDKREMKDLAPENPKLVKRLTRSLERLESLAGPACRPEATRQTPPRDWVMPDLSVSDPDAP